jgi:hypothetical protein
MAKLIEATGRSVLWRPIWVPTGTDLLAAATAVAATLIGLVALQSALVSGIALALLLALWTLELGGLPSPLARLCPAAATQDLLAPAPTESGATPTPVLLLVRTDLPAEQRGAISSICSRASELAWGIIALTLGAVAARALEAPQGAIGAFQAVPALASLALLAAVLVPKPQTRTAASADWTGLSVALELLAHEVSPKTLSCNLTAVGATEFDGAARVLKADPQATTAWRCWEFNSAEQLLAEIRASV